MARGVGVLGTAVVSHEKLFNWTSIIGSLLDSCFTLLFYWAKSKNERSRGYTSGQIGQSEGQTHPIGPLWTHLGR